MNHVLFLSVAYGVSAFVLIVTIAVVIWRHRKLTREANRLAEMGLRRASRDK